jgi:hypothetical protein
MTPQLSQKTKDRIAEVIEHYADEVCYTGFDEDHYSLYEKGQEKAYELLCDKFDDLDSDFEFMKDHYDENGELPNKEIFKKLCCDFAKQIIN